MSVSCDCIERIAPLLFQENIKLGTVIDMRTGAMRVALMTTRISNTGPKVRHILQAVYCPFCGRAYESVRERSSVPPTPVAYRHADTCTQGDAVTAALAACSCGWTGLHYDHISIARDVWRRHAVEAYHDEETVRWAGAQRYRQDDGRVLLVAPEETRILHAGREVRE